MIRFHWLSMLAFLGLAFATETGAGEPGKGGFNPGKQMMMGSFPKPMGFKNGAFPGGMGQGFQKPAGFGMGFPKQNFGAFNPAAMKPAGFGGVGKQCNGNCRK